MVDTIIIYEIKYKIEVSFCMVDVAIAHLICPIDEYASNGRRRVWFIPPIPLTNEEQITNP